MPADLIPPFGDSVIARDPVMFRRARKGAGFDSAKALAEAVNVYPLTIANIENPEEPRWTSLPVARRIAAALGRATGDLFDLSHLGLVVDADAVKAARARAGLTQGQLGRAVGLSPGMVSMIETGARPLLWRREARKVASVLGVKLPALFTEQDTAASTDTALSGRGRAAV